MRIIAFDQSSTITGFAILKDGKYERSGVFDLHTVGNGAVRLRRMMDLICRAISSANVDKVVIEDIYASKSIVAVKVLSQLQGAIIYYCHKNEIELEIIPPTTWRKRLGFKQNTQVKRWMLKKQAIEFIQEQCGKTVSDDEADAVCIALSEFITVDTEEECEGE